MKTWIAVLLILVLLTYPYNARVRQDMRLFDTYNNEWSEVLRYWHVQVDYAVANMCYIEWNTYPQNEPVHHEGWLPCDNLIPID